MSSKFINFRRSLNTVKVRYIYEAVENNIFVMQLMPKFTQVASESEVTEYFKEGKTHTKKNIAVLSKVLLDSDIQPPNTWAGKTTDSNKPPLHINL